MKEISIHQRNNLKKNEVLGMNTSTARNRLSKQLLFKYVSIANENICYQCKKEINDINQFTIEHKIPWLNNGKEYFWNLDNISFSHAKCNYAAAERKKGLKHPSQESYKRGCRCDDCKEIQKERIKKYRSNKKSSLP